MEKKQQGRRVVKGVLWALLIGLLMSIGFRIVYYGGMAATIAGENDNVDWIKVILGSIGRSYWTELVMIVVQTVLLVLFVFLGALLFRLRSHNPRLYGLIEIAFGVFIVGSLLSVAYDSNPLLNLLAMVSALYVTVRGFDNLSRSVTEPEDKAAWERLLGRF